MHFSLLFSGHVYSNQKIGGECLYCKVCSGSATHEFLRGPFIYFVSAAVDPTNKVPGFVYGIMVSIFLFFNCFAVNMVLQYKKVGPWRDYLFGEKVYIILSLTAKSALAWQVFGGTMRP